LDNSQTELKSYVISVDGDSGLSETDMAFVIHSLEEVNHKTLYIRSPQYDWYSWGIGGVRNDAIVQGEYEPNSQTLFIHTTSLLNVAEIACWYRQKMPDSCRILLWTGKTYTIQIEVKKALIPENIIKMMMAW